MHEEQEIINRILQRAHEMFRQFGVSKVTMEEIAASLSISKKTLYKHFSNKEDIVCRLIHKHKCEIGYKIDGIISDPNMPYMEKINRLFGYIGKNASKFQGPMMQDVMKNFPELWEEIKEFRRKSTYLKMSQLIKEGAAKGFIRKDINQDIITMIYVGAIHTIVVPETLEQIDLSAETVFGDIIKVLLEGILTTEGREQYLKELKDQNKQENIT